MTADKNRSATAPAGPSVLAGVANGPRVAGLAALARGDGREGADVIPTCHPGSGKAGDRDPVVAVGCEGQCRCGTKPFEGYWIPAFAGMTRSVAPAPSCPQSPPLHRTQSLVRGTASPPHRRHPGRSEVEIRGPIHVSSHEGEASRPRPRRARRGLSALAGVANGPRVAGLRPLPGVTSRRRHPPMQSPSVIPVPAKPETGIQ